MKKLAILFNGELRTFDNENVIKNWSKFYSKYDVDVYCCFWSKRGKSIFSKEKKIDDYIDQEEKMNLDYIKNIISKQGCNLIDVKLFNYDNWLERDEVKKWVDKYGYDPKYFNPLFVMGYLRNNVMKLFLDKRGDKKYDSVILTRPDNVFMSEPPEYFFDGSYDIWYQVNGRNHIVYSVFVSSNEENIINICKWYESDIIDESINHNVPRLRNHRMKHSGVTYSYLMLKGFDKNKIKSFKKRLFAEPYRYVGDIEKRTIYNEGDENWFPKFKD